MASEKNHFKKAISYIKYEIENADNVKKSVLEKELEFWTEKWSYTKEEIDKIAPADKNDIRMHYIKDLAPTKYTRTKEASEILANNFDKLIEEQEKLSK